MSAIRSSTHHIVVALLVTVTSPLLGQEVLWQIGKFDNTYAEFHHLENLGLYPKTFPKDVRFVIGKSSTQTDWSFVHPGPADAWAGRKPHAFTIEFELQETPPEEATLRLDFIEAHYRLPPRLTIQINDAKGVFSLKRGAGDLALMDPSKGREQVLNVPFDGGLLRKGRNRISIVNDAGSWALYDAVALLKAAKPTQTPSRMKIVPTDLFVRTEAGLEQVATVHMEGPAARKGGILKVNLGKKTIERKIKAARIGSLDSEITLPAVTKETDVRFDFSYGTRMLLGNIKVVPSKRWKVYVAQSVHTDIGYTDLQKNVIARHNANTDLAMTLCRKYPDYKWNLESSWAAQMYERARSPEQMKRLLSLSRERRIGIEANYLNMLTGLCSAEELTRMLYMSAALAARNGIPFESVTLTDAPSHVWSIPTILRRAGIKYLSMGINQTRAPLLRGSLDELSPVWWEGPDGSKVLSWFSNGYAWASRVGLSESEAAVRQRLGNLLKKYEERSDYPYDAILLHGGYGDNAAISGKIAETAKAWNTKYAYPKIIQCNMADFFRYVEKNFGEKIPSIRGCGGSYWEDGAASSAHETTINRNNHDRVVAAEACWAALAWMGKPQKYPQRKIADIWDNILLYDEHTWGAHSSISAPEAEFATKQWQVKAAYATDARHESQTLLNDGLALLGKNVAGQGKGVLVYNPLSWNRSDAVRVTLPGGAALVDPNGKTCALQTLSIKGRNKKVCFVAEDVPASGYRRYDIVSASSSEEDAPMPTADHQRVIENLFYRVGLDEKTGGISSIVDKESGVELVDQSSLYKLGEVIYASGGEGTQAIQSNPNLPPAKYVFSTPNGSKWKVSSGGNVLTWARSYTKTKMLPEVGVEVTLYNDVKRLDLAVHLNKALTYKKEAVYVAFPFAGDKPKFRMEVGGGWVRPNVDHLPGACLDWFSVQNSVTVNTGRAGVSWSAVDTPLITLCDITTGRWLDRLPITNGTIFAYVMNNYWFTNYKAGQDGKFAFRYSITSDRTMNTTAAARHGWGANQPLIAVPVDAPLRQSLPAEGSFFRISAPNVVLTAFKKAEDGRGYVLRFLENGGKNVRFELTTGVLPAVRKAWRCDLVERNLGKLQVAKETVSIDIKAFGIETIRVRP